MTIVLREVPNVEGLGIADVDKNSRIRRFVEDRTQSIAAIARILETLRCDRIDVNTPVRPPVPERGAVPCGEDVLSRALAAFGPRAHAIGSFTPRTGDAAARRGRKFDDRDKDVREMLLRRPCTGGDIAASLNIEESVVAEIVERLTAAGLVSSRPGEGGTYYHATGRTRTSG